MIFGNDRTYSANAIAEVSQQTNGALRVKMHDKQL
jgi:hypothetical protein